MGPVSLSMLILACFACGISMALSSVILRARDDNLPARVPYVFPPPGTNSISDEIRSRRANKTLLDLDGALLNAPLIAQTWNELFGVIRDNNTIPADMREMMILRVGVLNAATYVWLQHEPPAREAGMTTAQLLEVRNAPPFVASLNTSTVLNPALLAALDFTDYLTRNVYVPEPIYNRLNLYLNDSQMVEATATAGGYNFVSRFVMALDVDAKMTVPVPMPE